VVAHRGASAAAPENTLSAVRAAIAMGADAVEIDVRRTRDGEFVVIHDPDPTRTTDAPRRRLGRRTRRVDELTLAELRRFDAGSWKGSSFRGERIPTLAEVLDLVGPTRLQLVVEVKRPVGRDPRDLVHLAGTLAEANVALRRVTVQSFDWDVVRGLRHLIPDVALAVLSRSVPRDLASLSRWADQVSLHRGGTDRDAVDAISGWGMRCVAWTVNRPPDMLRLSEIGVDGVITDRPDVLVGLVHATRRRRPDAGGLGGWSVAPEAEGDGGRGRRCLVADRGEDAGR
jgi:glycerophosphoryl diester phosphodiesterase